MTPSHSGLGPAEIGGMDRSKPFPVSSSPFPESGPGGPRFYDNSSNTIRETGDGQRETSPVEVRAYRRALCLWLFASSSNVRVLPGLERLRMMVPPCGRRCVLRLIAVWPGAPTAGHRVRAYRRALLAA